MRAAWGIGVLFIVACGGGESDKTPPVVVITTPGSGSVVGPTGATLAFTITGGDLAGCSLDGQAVPGCQSGQALVAGSGAHSVTVSAVDDAGNQGSATASFTVDGAAPVPAFTLNEASDGDAEIAIAVTDLSAVATVSCSLDGGAPVACAGGSVAYSELSPGRHHLSVTATDTWGNAATAGFDFVETYGDAGGQLVLFGWDFEVPVIAKLPSHGGGSFEHMLATAVSRSHAVGFDRDLAVLTYVGEATLTEQDNVVVTLDDLAPGHQRTNLGDPGALATMLPGHDVFLVFDQNGAATDALGTAWETTLRDFLDAGGVVIVLDGTVEGSASNTHRVLAPSLLDIDGAAPASACGSARCNTIDPLLADVLDDPCADGVTFDTPEPWVTLWSELDAAMVLSRPFGRPAHGAVAIVAGANLTADQVAFFHHPGGGSLRSGCLLAANGTAVHQAERGAGISLGTTNGANHDLITYLGVQPGEAILVRPPPTDQATLGDVGVSLYPVLVPGATSYWYRVSCRQALADPPDVPLLLDVVCAHGPEDAPSYPIAGEALAADGALLSYSLLSHATELGGDTLVLPAWQTPNVTVDVSRGVSDVASLRLSAALIAGDVTLPQSPRVIETPGASVTAQFYAVPGSQAPYFDRFVTTAEIVFEQGNSSYLASASRTAIGPLPSGQVAMDLGALLLPRLRAPAVSFSEGRMGIAFTSDSPLVADGVVARVLWPDHSWTLIFPPGTSVLAPSNPGALFWPAAQDAPEVTRIDAHERSDLDGYDDFRGVGLWSLPATASGLTVRRTTLQIAN